MGTPGKILILIGLFLVANLSYATGGSGEKTQDQTGELQQEDKKKNKKNSLSLENLEDVDQIDMESVDSLGDDSVSKYNFIFYFLYKFKYSEEETSKALF